jgi:hypothetical protein
MTTNCFQDLWDSVETKEDREKSELDASELEAALKEVEDDAMAEFAGCRRR